MSQLLSVQTDQGSAEMAQGASGEGQQTPRISQGRQTVAQACLPGIRRRKRRVATGPPPGGILKKLRHVSNEVHRCQFNGLERIFAEKWMHECEPRPGLNNGFGTLQELFTHKRPDAFLHSVYCDLLINQRDATVAATVVQWLGTNCGFGFLTEALRRGGYRITDEKHLHEPYNQTADWDRHRLPSAWHNLARTFSSSLNRSEALPEIKVTTQRDALHKKIYERGLREMSLKINPAAVQESEREAVRARIREVLQARQQLVEKRVVAVRQRLDSLNPPPSEDQP